MTHAGSPEHPQGQIGSPSAATTESTILPPEELAVLHAEDRAAATRIVGLMVTVFISGLIGYILIALWAA